MKPKLIPVLEQCIENGLELGWNRAHKHHNEPQENWIFEEQARAIWNEIYERFDFQELSGNERQD